MDDIEPSDYNAKRFTALLFTGVAAITMAGLIAFLSSTKPQLYTGLQGKDKAPLVQEVSNLISSCHFVYYDGCYEDQTFLDPLNLDFETEKELRRIGRAYNINPQVLVTLSSMNNNRASTDNAESIAQTLTKIKVQTPTGDLKVYNHPQFGSFKLDKTNYETLVLINYLAATYHTKEAFIQAVSQPVDDDQTLGFIETHTHLFGTSPTK